MDRMASEASGIPPLSLAGVLLGGLSLLLVLVQFYGGPFDPSPSLEEVVAEKAVAIRDATVAALRGEKYEAVEEEASFSIDRALRLAGAGCAALAVTAGFGALLRRERVSAALGGILLGGSAIAFQFAGVVLGAVLLVLLLGPLLSALDFDFSFNPFE